MKLKLGDFRVDEGKNVDLSKWPTKIKALYRTDEEYQEQLDSDTAKLDDLQRLQYAHDRYAVLAIFQAMDGAGKDGAIRHVLSGVNPQGFQVYSFKQPSAEELDHDFLWRTWRCMPERGRLGIFNRSYYEEVLVVRVHPEILDAQNLPEGLVDKKTIWKERFRSIVEMERHLHRNGTRIVKFFLHVSKEEQRKRLLARIEEPDKNWKFSLADIGERKLWKSYMRAYEDCLSETSTDFAPWYVVPADDKKNARLIIARILLETFRDLKMEYPEVGAERKAELEEVHRVLMKPEKKS
jgi:PPK2 family polyphosphate:nucleotide phosphotransferase